METPTNNSLASAIYTCTLTSFSLLALEPQMTALISPMAVQPGLGV